MGKADLSNKKAKKRRKHSRKTGFYYSFLTIVLLFCLIQIGYGAILNISKIVAYKAKTVTLEKLLKSAKEKNQDLKSEKKLITSDSSLEEIARNNLKMAGEDEVLIIINQKVEEPASKSKKWKLGGENWFKKKDKSVEPQGAIYIPQEVVEE